MVSFECSAITGGGAKNYLIEIVEIEPKALEQYLNKELFDGLCMTGCPNYGKKWSCPPFAPAFTDFTNTWKKLFVIYMQIDMEQFFYIKNDYLKIKAANVILKSRAEKFLRVLSQTYGSYISTGSCRLCKPCKRKINCPCAHPDIMTYSFEALGIDVGKMVKDYFNRMLLWYKPRCLPKYTSIACGLLTNEDITPQNLRGEYSILS